MEVPLEKGMAIQYSCILIYKNCILIINSSILAWRIPRTEKPGGLQFVGSQRVAQDWAANTHTHTGKRLDHWFSALGTVAL